MLKEAFEYLARLGRETVPDIVKADAEPAHVYYLRGEGGSLTRTVAEPPPVKHAADSLDTIAGLATDHALGATVWVRPGTVVLTFGDQARNQARLMLPYSDPFTRLLEWAKNKPAMAQAVLISEMRTTFHGCLAQHPDLLAVLKKVRFNLNQQVVGEVGHGRSSLGKTIEGQVYGTADIPEYVTLHVPIYAAPALASVRAAVPCALDPDAASGHFRVIPLPGALDAAADYAAGEVASRIREDIPNDVPVLFGAP